MIQMIFLLGIEKYQCSVVEIHNKLQADSNLSLMEIGNKNYFMGGTSS